MQRQRIPIPFGGGLDRYTGPMVVDRNAQEDVRNVHLVDGWAHLRRGAAEVAVFTNVGHTVFDSWLDALWAARLTEERLGWEPAFVRPSTSWESC